jgi:hypothetical protein
MVRWRASCVEVRVERGLETLLSSHLEFISVFISVFIFLSSSFPIIPLVFISDQSSFAS